MAKSKLRDGEAKEILLRWPRSTASLWEPEIAGSRWLRAQPVDGTAKGPRLSSPGAELFSTQPDGMFVLFAHESVDVVAIEICGTVQNLNDKRSRYFPSSHSILLRCTAHWMAEEVTVQGGGRRVRHLRVLYALPNETYQTWCKGHTPTGYEYFCAHSSLDGYNSQPMQRFLKQMSIRSHFYTRIR